MQWHCKVSRFAASHGKELRTAFVSRDKWESKNAEEGSFAEEKVNSGISWVSGVSNKRK